MTLVPGELTATLRVAHRPWGSETSLPAMSNAVDRHERIRLTDHYVVRDGRPAIPVSGELHYSRVPRALWKERLLLMRSGGITVVAAYVFWIHHEEQRGVVRFDDQLDIRAFVETCAELGLDVVLRIGPWVHGEARNGGFPDWVQAAEVAHRTDDPGYLELVAGWYRALGEQLRGVFGPSSAVVGIQIENELYDQPEHIRTLKRLAREAGMSAPIWTATGWGGAALPEDEVLPLFGGYGDGFWVDHDAPWDVTFHEHFFFSHVWDDPGIGADLRQHGGIGGGSMIEPARTPSPLYPAATCELGGGMARAYHRRPVLTGADIAAVAHNKIGNGSGWQGYYMYTGGTNPRGAAGMQESHASRYPNDLAVFDYDFGAPISATGRIRDSHAQLRRQHAFLAAFGEALAPMPSTLPQTLPSGVDDTTTLRWALRSDGRTGFVFVTWHQPYDLLEEYEGAQFTVELDDDTVTFPAAPLTIPAGTIAHWPINLEVSGTVLRWATASPLTVLDGGPQRTLVLTAERGVPAEFCFGPGTTVLGPAPGIPVPGITERDGVITAEASVITAFTVVTEGVPLAILALPADVADETWVLDDGATRMLVLSEEPVWCHGGRLRGRTGSARPEARVYSPLRGGFVRVDAIVEGTAVGEPVPATPTSAPAVPPAGYGSAEGRASAPTDGDFARAAARYELALPAKLAAHSELEVRWTGDVARLLVGGQVVADQFWAGTEWVIDLGVLPEGAAVALEILPLSPEAAVGLPASAQRKRDDVAGALWSLDSLRVVTRVPWHAELPS
ncbi:beta-galactosidase [Herbiconiux sp. KACC 21604]|uniref:beta-galactosidase n=1 Tax=unclassified Herbiconiux TaxID=2618217 RepID=UPI0014916A94|nr:beta-galactosidase [Herbiconiux sp. SALV-R1]QJU55713.1 beta-galactosidase [Herbiconiux sp. SALV-R1]WPO86919.1 beta-galactosidase [Herbiconiux sp. KACC 21604]